MARRGGVVVVSVAALAACLALLAATAGAARSTQASSLDLRVLTQLNQIRSEHGLHSLELSLNLSQAALQHSREMVVDGYFAHDSANGAPFWKRIRAFYSAARFGYWSVGENLFWTSGPTSATAGVDAWMASPMHRANILDPGWREIGIAAVSSPDAPGTFGDTAVTVITTDFGVRR